MMRSPKSCLEFRRYAPALVALLVVVAACGRSALEVQARGVDLLARTANHALPALVQVYEDEGSAAIEHAPDAPSAQRALDAVVARWRGVWGACGAHAEPGCHGGAWAALRAALDVWSDALDRARNGPDGGAAVDLTRLAAAVRDAWCALRAALPSAVEFLEVQGLRCPALDAGA